MNPRDAWAWTALAALVGLRALDMLPAPQFATTFGVLAGLYLAGKAVGDAAAKVAEGYAANAVAKAKGAP